MEKKLASSVLPVAPIEPVAPAPVIDDESDDSLIRHPNEYALYVKWRTIPALLRNPPPAKDGTRLSPEDFALSLGIDDEEAMEFLGLKTKAEFAAKYGVSERTLTRWNYHIKRRDIFADLREFALPLHRNVMLSLYNKAIRGGLPEHYALWMKAFAQWNEKMQIDLTKRTIRTIRYEIVDTRPVPAVATEIHEQGNRPELSTHA